MKEIWKDIKKDRGFTTLKNHRVLVVLVFSIIIIILTEMTINHTGTAFFLGMIYREFSIKKL